MKHNMLFAAVYEALSPDTCAVCRLSLVSVHRMLDTFLYEQVNDPWTRRKLLSARGFCAPHAWQVRNLNSPLGTAIVHRHLLEEFLAALQEAIRSRPSGAPERSRLLWPARPDTSVGGAVTGWLEPQAPCLACNTQWEAEDRYIASVAHALDDSDFQARYMRAFGVCARHLPLVLSRVASPAAAEWLVQAEGVIMKQLLWNLSEFIRKHDYRFVKEPRGDEQASWIRVMEKLAGAPGMVWRR